MHLALRRTGAPSAEPLTLAEAKAHLRVDGTAEDALIVVYLQAARERIEAETGRCLLPQDWVMDLPAWPQDDVIEPWHAPLVSVDSVKTVDAAGAETTLSASTYSVNAPAGPMAMRGRIVPAYGYAWPSIDSAIPVPIRVAYRAGYASVSEVPAALRAALLLALGDLYANREAASVAKVTDNPAIDRLITPFRLFWG